MLDFERKMLNFDLTAPSVGDHVLHPQNTMSIDGDTESSISPPLLYDSADWYNGTLNTDDKPNSILCEHHLFWKFPAKEHSGLKCRVKKKCTAAATVLNAIMRNKNKPMKYILVFAHTHTCMRCRNVTSTHCSIRSCIRCQARLYEIYQRPQHCMIFQNRQMIDRYLRGI